MLKNYYVPYEEYADSFYWDSPPVCVDFETLRDLANGFVGLANNFVSYAGLITIALNSLAGRFITISITRGDEKAANRYFTSVFYANLFIAAVLALIGGGIIFFLERLVNVPEALVGDVRWLFVFVFLNCIIGVIGSVFGVATFARNKLYLSSLREIEGNLARALCIIALFALSRPRVCYLGAASLLSGSYVLLRNIRFTKKLLPEIRIAKEHFDLGAVRELIASGIWNTTNPLFQKHEFFGEGMSPVMAYAPSIGNATMQDLSVIPDELLHRMDPILVRDDRSLEFVRSKGIDAPVSAIRRSWPILSSSAETIITV